MRSSVMIWGMVVAQEAIVPVQGTHPKLRYRVPAPWSKYGVGNWTRSSSRYSQIFSYVQSSKGWTRTCDPGANVVLY